MLDSFYESLVNSLEEAIIVVSRGSRIVFVNKAAEELLGVHVEGLRGKDVSLLFDDDHAVSSLLRKTLEEMRPASGKDALVRMAGSQRVDFTMTPLLHRGDFEGAIVLLRRVPDFFKKDGDQLDSLLFLLSTVAHEIKNPLAGIKGAAQLLKRGGRERASEYLDVIIKETERLDEVVTSYLFMGRRPVFSRLNVHEVLEEALGVMGGQLRGRDIVVRRGYDPSLPMIKGDAGKLLQVFINLIKNSGEAMPQGGTLQVVTKPAYEYLIEKKKRVKMKLAMICFIDTGTGIDAEGQGKIFLPFHSGKREGTGLGLTISQKIVLDHGGLIKIRTKPGEGTAVNVYLPFAEGQ